MNKPTGKLAFAYRTIAAQQERIEQLEAELARAHFPTAGGAVPKMPATQDRRPYDYDDPDGYLEGNHDWAENNNDAVEWLADNHVAIRLALADAPHPVSGEQKPVHWRALLAADQRPQQLNDKHVVGFTTKESAEAWVAEKKDFQGWDYVIEALYADPPAAQKLKPDAVRKRFSDIEDEIMAGKHNAQSVFTAMRTASLYIGQPAAQDVSGLGYQVLFDAIAAATRVSAEKHVAISVEAFLASIAARRAQAQGGDA